MKPQDIVNKAVGISEKTGYVDMVTLAKLLGINVFLSSDEHEDFNACIQFDSDTKKYDILVNPAQPFERQRFSIAHEIAHFILHKEKLDTTRKLNRNSEDITNKLEEEQADKLAAELLMPTPLVMGYIEQLGLNKKHEVKENIIEKVAGYFKVSRIVAAIKLRSLKFFVPYASFT